jgi:hypothetical protein
MAKELGLPVSTDIPSDVLELMKLYPQPVRAQGAGGGVEYLPIPYQPGGVGVVIRLRDTRSNVGWKRRFYDNPEA